MVIPCRILFVDDHMANVRSMRRILDKANLRHVVSVINNIQDLQPALKSFEPTIVIANKQLNVEDEVLKLKKEHAEGAFVALLLDKPAESDYVSIWSQEIDDYLLKSELERLPVIVRNAHHKSQLHMCKRELAELYDNYEQSREKEKAQISRELHDELGQVLTALKIDLNLLERRVVQADTKLSDDQLKKEFKNAVQSVDNSMNTVRRIASGLRPEILDKLGLLEAIEWLVDVTIRKYGLVGKTDLPLEVNLPEAHHITIYRIIQEALTNVIKHASASEVVISLKEVNGRLHLKVNDDGKGFTKNAEPDRTSLGLVGLRERVMSLKGRFEITSEEKGTLVSVEIPIDTHLMNEKV